MNGKPTRLSPLHGVHVSAGATFVSIGDWQVATAMSEIAMCEIADEATNEIAAAQTGLGVADLSDRAKIIVEGADAGAMLSAVLGGTPLGVNRATEIGERLYVASLRRDRFYISGATDREAELLGKLNDAAASSKSLITVTDVTDARSELLLTGPNAVTCLSRLCGLDFHERVFPTLTAKETSIAKIRQLILRCDKGELPAYIISGGRSSAVYLWKTLLEAGHDLSMQAVGREAVEELWGR